MREAIKRGEIVENKTLRVIYFLLGIGFLGVGFMGVILPVIPGTIFVIISAYFFARSSKRFLHFILHNKVFGKYIHAYVHGAGMPLRAKIIIVVTILISFAFGCYYYAR